MAKSAAVTTYIQAHGIVGFERDGDFYYFLTDALGSVRDIVGYNSGTSQWEVVQSYDYTENGKKTTTNPTGLQSAKTWVGGLSVNDDTSDSGLYLMGHRHYDPGLGRFLSRDPIGFSGGLNLYSYGANSPVSMVDPEGLDTVGSVFYEGLRQGSKAIGGAAARSTTFAGRTPVPLHVKAGLIALGIVADLGGTALGDATTWTAQGTANATAQQLAARQAMRQTRQSTQTEEEEPCPKTLYHYTSKQGYEGIVSIEAINPSTDLKYARYGPGQYFTNISPEMIGVSLTINQAMRSLFGMPWGRESRMTHYLEVEVTGLSITNPRPGTYLHSSEVPLPITNRLVRGGAR